MANELQELQPDQLQLLRQRRLLGLSSLPEQSQTQEQTPALEELQRTALAGPPKLTDYHPSKIRQVLATVAGIGPGNYQRGMDIYNRPYTKALTDYQARVESLGTATGAESDILQQRQREALLGVRR